ncbi:DUF4293 domain-containing protein [uncultured Planktosalinus sp.]|uniref:DUF4293 domain-containing protein n=1 Tax=uncultured Planktosalinus sp. TaxID=1810935 RepID=UPI0030DDD6F2
MIQRIQTLYMLLVAFIMTGLFVWFPEVKNESGDLLYTRDEPVFFALIFISIALAIIAILTYKRRKRQFVFNRLNILSNFILLGVFVYRSLSVPGETLVSEKGIGMFLPILSIVLLVMANRSIIKDENLVKSVDRLR